MAESLIELNEDNKSDERTAMNAQKGKFLKFTFIYIIGKFEYSKEKENIKASQRIITDYLQRIQYQIDKRPPIPTMEARSQLNNIFKILRLELQNKISESTLKTNKGELKIFLDK